MWKSFCYSQFILEELLFCTALLIGAVAADHGQRRFEKNLQVEPDGLFPDITQIHPHHFVECGAASAVHLPLARDTGLYFQDPAPVPQQVMFKFIRNGRTWPHERHLAPEDIQKLRNLIETAFAQKPPNAGYSRIIFDLEGAVAF